SFLNVLTFPLPLDPFYKNLIHNENDLNSFKKECESLYSENKRFKNIRLCSILLWFLQNSKTRTENKNFAYDECLLFNYWIYGELARKYNYNYSAKVFPAFAELQQIWNSLIEEPKKNYYYDKCNPDSSIVNQYDWDQRKELYDYCVNYELLKPQFEPYKKNCKQHYAYIKSKVPLYKYYKERCIPDGKYNCPDFYSKCINYDPDNVLRELSCYDVMQKEEATAEEKALSEKLHPDLSPGGTYSSDDLQSKKDSSPPATQAGNVFLGVVVTSMTFGALYKFTPLGNMLRNRFGWNNNMRNFNGGDNGLFDYASEAFNPYSGEEHYIGYHPA
ncbi:PIR protein, partial [Plasmodium vivax]